MAKSKFGMMRFEEDELEYAGAFITPPNHRVIVSVHCDKFLPPNAGSPSLWLNRKHIQTGTMCRSPFRPFCHA